MNKKVRNQLTKQIRDNEKLKKKEFKRSLNDNDNINENDNDNDNDNNYQIKKRNKNNIKKLLIFDLNGVLIYTRKKKKKKNNNFTMRPHVEKFIDAMSKKYQLAVWTSKTFERAESMVQKLFHSYDLLFTWYNDKCDKKYSDDAVYMTKDLRKVWNQFDNYDETNTILLDDSEEKCIVNNSYNCIHPRTFIKKGTDHLKNFIYDENILKEEDDELIIDGNLFNYLDALSLFDGSISSFVNENKHYNEL